MKYDTNPPTYRTNIHVSRMWTRNRDKQNDFSDEKSLLDGFRYTNGSRRVMKHKELYRKKHIRDDGWLSELVSMRYGDTPFDCLHSYLVLIKPRKTRAKHYHKEKEEWIAIVFGTVALLLKDVYSGEHEKIILDATTEEYKLIYLPPFIAHAIKNIGDCDASVVVFSTTIEDPNDTIPYEFEDV